MSNVGDGGTSKRFSQRFFCVWFELGVTEPAAHVERIGLRRQSNLTVRMHQLQWRVPLLDASFQTRLLCSHGMVAAAPAGGTKGLNPAVTEGDDPNAFVILDPDRRGTAVVHVVLPAPLTNVPVNLENGFLNGMAQLRDCLSGAERDITRQVTEQSAVGLVADGQFVSQHVRDIVSTVTVENRERGELVAPDASSIRGASIFLIRSFVLNALTSNQFRLSLHLLKQN